MGRYYSARKSQEIDDVPIWVSIQSTYSGYDRNADLVLSALGNKPLVHRSLETELSHHKVCTGVNFLLQVLQIAQAALVGRREVVRVPRVKMYFWIASNSNTKVV